MAHVRLLIVNSTLHIGGAEQIAASLARHMDRSAYSVTACFLKEGGVVADQLSLDGVDIVPIPGITAGRRDYLTSLKLRKLIRSRQIQIIHTHDVHGLIDGAVCRTTIPSLRFVHTFHYGRYPVRHARYRHIEGLLWRTTDALVAVSHSQASAIRNLYKIPAQRIRVIWNGVEDTPLTSMADSRTSQDHAGTPIIACVCTLIHQKGLEYLVEAAAILRREGARFVLHIAGDGSLRGKLEERVSALGLGAHVRFLGWIPQAAARVLPACDIFVQSSLWEAMSIVVLEAMAAGKPVVVTSVGENPRVVVPGETGLIVPPADPSALAASLATLLSDTPLRIRMGKAARRRYESLFTMQRMIEEHDRLYRYLIRGAD